jgi:mannose-6-phosphate isomerase-like protein (cupin superfamily)
MNKIEEYIKSGILEMYVLGTTSLEETSSVNEMAHLHEEIRLEIEEITQTLQSYSASTSKEPSAGLRPFVLAVVDYTERLNGGEAVTIAPTLNKNSKIEDFNQWLEREDMVLPDDFDNMYAKIIGFTPEATTAISWVKAMSALEVHDNEYERFLIIEGTCNVKIGQENHHLIAGDYLEIPLHIEHALIVTSEIPCKFILQRVAA